MEEILTTSNDMLPEAEDTEDLQLDPNTVKDRQSVYTSLTERYGVSVFTDEFRLYKTISDSRKDLRQEHLMQSVFSGVYQDGEQEDNGFVNLLFIQQKEQVITQDFADGLSVNTLWYVAALLGAGLLFGTLLLRYQRKKKKEREDHVAHIKLEYTAQEPAIGHTGQ